MCRMLSVLFSVGWGVIAKIRKQQWTLHYFESLLTYVMEYYKPMNKGADLYIFTHMCNLAFKCKDIPEVFKWVNGIKEKTKYACSCHSFFLKVLLRNVVRKGERREGSRSMSVKMLVLVLVWATIDAVTFFPSSSGLSFFFPLCI